ARYRAAFGYSFPQLAFAVQGPVTEQALESAIQTMVGGAIDQAGNPISVSPTILLVPPLYMFQAQKLLNRTLTTYGSDNLPVNYNLELRTSRYCGVVPSAAVMQRVNAGKA
ncbi:MAG: Mu-like prophage major head subunit gpT family protein, partial [Mycobacterium sp.]